MKVERTFKLEKTYADHLDRLAEHMTWACDSPDELIEQAIAGELSARGGIYMEENTDELSK